MGTAIKHPVPERVKPSCVIFDIQTRHSDAQPWASECPDVKNYKWRLNPLWHRMLYSFTHMATVVIEGLTSHSTQYRSFRRQWILSTSSLTRLVSIGI